MKQFDSEQLKNIFNLRSFVTKDDEKAGDFIDNLQEKKQQKSNLDQPELPF